MIVGFKKYGDSRSGQFRVRYKKKDIRHFLLGEIKIVESHCTNEPRSE